MPGPSPRIVALAVGMGLAAALAVLHSAVLSQSCLAHEGHQTLVEHLAHEIALNPGNPALRVERAEHLRRLGRWEEAERELSVADSLGADTTLLLLCRAQMATDRGRDDAALALVDGALERDPRLAPAWFLRAELSERTDDPARAARDLARAIECAPAPTPSHFARLAALRTEPEVADTVAALAALDDGLVRLGSVPMLVLAAVELEVGRGNYEAALARLERLPARHQSLEPVRVRRAEILSAAGRELEANAVYTEILASLESPTRRPTPASSALAARVRAALTASGAGAEEDR